MAPSQAALQRVQPKAGDIHSLRASTPIKGGKDAQELRDMRLIDF